MSPNQWVFTPLALCSGLRKNVFISSIEKHLLTSCKSQHPPTWRSCKIKTPCKPKKWVDQSSNEFSCKSMLCLVGLEHVSRIYETFVEENFIFAWSPMKKDFF